MTVLWAGIMTYTNLCLPWLVKDYLTCYRDSINICLIIFLNEGENDAQFILFMTQWGRAFLAVPITFVLTSPEQWEGMVVAASGGHWARGPFPSCPALTMGLTPLAKYSLVPLGALFNSFPTCGWTKTSRSLLLVCWFSNVYKHYFLLFFCMPFGFLK